jgi:hypothetical protein
VALSADADDNEPEQRTEYLWPCNVRTWQHWQAVQTQWRVGMSGASGLDYAGVLAYLQAVVSSKQQRRDIFDGIQAAEHATLVVWREQAERDKPKT